MSLNLESHIPCNKFSVKTQYIREEGFKPVSCLVRVIDSETNKTVAVALVNADSQSGGVLNKKEARALALIQVLQDMSRRGLLKKDRSLGKCSNGFCPLPSSSRTNVFKEKQTEEPKPCQVPNQFSLVL